MNKKLTLPRRKSSLDARRARSGYLFTLPFIIGIVLVYLPILIDSVLLSFYKYQGSDTSPGEMEYVFNGLESYVAAFETPDFIDALLGGFQQLLLEVPTIVIFSLFIAVVLNQKMLGRAVFRAIFFVPVIISTGLIETISASDDMTGMMEGGINDGTGGEGIMQVEDLETMFAGMGFGSDIVSMVVGLVNDIYRIINYSGVQMLIFLAALQGISTPIYEAATIDGATGWETFWKITFPMISPMILVNAAYTIIDSFTRSTNVTMQYITNNIGDVGQAAAMSWIYFLIVIVVIALVAAILSSFIFYQRRD
ncbi:MAG: sugar ABC transporter permease [Clostridia bacterium]|nr:sugar ABC transporter permease [Clostridia bacterium]